MASRKSKSKRKAISKKACRKLVVEHLEQRRLLATLTDDQFDAELGQTLNESPLSNDIWGQPSPGCDPYAMVLSTPGGGDFQVFEGGSCDEGDSTRLDFSFKPSQGSGSTSFTYTIADGPPPYPFATVTINFVNNVNDPAAVTDDEFVTGLNAELDASSVLANDSDYDNDSLTAILVDEPSNGVVTLASDGNFLYTPNIGYYGPDSFTYKANDGSQDSDVATVSITVLPPETVDDSYVVEADGILVVDEPGLFSNDSYYDGAGLSATKIDGPDHGTLTLNANGSFTYVPAANYAGYDSFTYAISDGIFESYPATVSIAVLRPDLAVTSFTSYGGHLAIDYSVYSIDPGAFTIAIYASSDGESLDHLLQVVDAGEGMSTVGPHSVYVDAEFAEVIDDYMFIAVLDPEDEIVESQETNNIAAFTGLAAPVLDPTTGAVLLYVYGSDDDDDIEIAGLGPDAWLVMSGPSPTLDPPEPGTGVPFYDVDGDGQVTRRDAEAVILGHSQTSTPWQNPTNRFDVNNDGSIAPSDAAVMISWKNAPGLGFRILDMPRGVNDPYLDVSGDNIFSQLDYDQFIDKINGGDGFIDEEDNESHNGLMPQDVDDDGFVTPADALAILDYLGIAHKTYNALAIDQVTVRSGAGNDKVSAPLLETPIPFHIYGGAGADTLYGGLGNDQIFGGADNDIIDGDDGNDVLFGGEGDDTVNGHAGKDQLIGDEGNDTLTGGDGDDILAGGDGADTVQGNDGDDQLFGGADTDSLDGGSGSNTVSADGVWSPAQIQWGFIHPTYVYEGHSTPFTMMRLPGGGQGEVTITVELLDGSARDPGIPHTVASHGADYGGATTITLTIPDNESESPESYIPLLLDDNIELEVGVYWMRITDVSGGYDPYGPSNWALMYIHDRSIQTENDIYVIRSDDPVLLDVLGNDTGGTSELHIASYTEPQYGILEPLYDSENRIGALLYTRDPNNLVDQYISYYAADNDNQQKIAYVALLASGINITIFDGQDGKAVLDTEEYSVGAFTVANLNDTDGDGIQDRIDGSVIQYTDSVARGVDEVDLMRLTIDRPAGYIPGTAVEIIVRHGTDFVHFWTTKTKQTELTLDQYDKIDIGFGSGEMTKDVWIEAQYFSGFIRDIEIEARYDGKSDSVRATAVWTQPMSYLVDNALSPAQILVTNPWNQLSGTGTIKAMVNGYGGVGVRPPSPIGVKNGILQAFEVFPLGIQNEPRVNFDITRRMELAQAVLNNGQLQILTPPGFVRFPNLLDEANDDAQGNTDEEGPNANGLMYVVDYVGPEKDILPFPEWTYYSHHGNFEEFIRVTIGGQQAAGNGLKGSRASPKVNWHSRQSLFVHPTTKRLFHGGGPNDIDEGHIPIP